jgi:hypothetical protein
VRGWYKKKRALGARFATRKSRRGFGIATYDRIDPEVPPLQGVPPVGNGSCTSFRESGMPRGGAIPEDHVAGATVRTGFASLGCGPSSGDGGWPESLWRRMERRPAGFHPRKAEVVSPETQTQSSKPNQAPFGCDRCRPRTQSGRSKNRVLFGEDRRAGAAGLI